ncbi:helix-turn-helix domain-containing protein [Pseudomonas protegens]|jgi:AraC-like DNA-binding protein|uniref:Transcriptional regulator, AraC family n=1 Tax=Pseudomonas protegens (strain DSM 19095 / LMG 27888 / CFBP 6595 / CHA0) TaxID=1124983 RepID=A0A2C9EMF2_PSEPH|nr:helix-turn-helix domain-containing protein [Pseudomonas protegens]AGL84769.1 transcriptional regulator, AraC family [Pseudomonas protegens CHA0]MBP5110750.1 helix-turn-helix domain-containing protein [Pseudomonas protegens]QTU23805.1 helix-turn-helix domain-containing protein [Pseudomonas protegens]QTU33336.1 helix-turn-helix domain-containing protein [Pseudomonas protegens]RLO23847.1 AraC family transcriptional regulator [Pseudomonas protegens]
MTASNPLQVQAFNTFDVADQIRATPGWVQHYQQMSPGHFNGLVRYLDLQGVEIYEECMNTRVEQNFSAPQGALAFCFDRSDNALYVLNGESRNIWITPENYQEVAVVFGPEFVRGHGLGVERLDGLFMAPLNSQQNALFCRWLSSTLTRLSQTLDPPSREALTQQLLEDCLYILDNACVRLDRGGLQRRSEERGIMQRVAQWAADVPEETLNLLELSQVAGVSLRQLQSAFKAFTGMAPSQWLRLRRLNSAHRELLSRGSTETTVAEVAMHWSFWHLGRFSSSYRALFKELPSQTLKRSAVARR